MLTRLLQARFWHMCYPMTTHVTPATSAEDHDVAAERTRLEALPAASNVIEVRDLRKVWPARGSAEQKIAVHNSTFGVPSQECFGLLGPNGAG